MATMTVTIQGTTTTTTTTSTTTAQPLLIALFVGSGKDESGEDDCGDSIVDCVSSGCDGGDGGDGGVGVGVTCVSRHARNKREAGDLCARMWCVRVDEIRAVQRNRHAGG